MALAVTVSLAWMTMGAACGGRTPFYPLDGGVNNQNRNTNQNRNPGECQAAGDCVVAVQTNACCACPEAASAADLAADPCLIPVGDERPAGCQVDCPAVPCAPCPTAGRTADCQQGQCVLKEGRCTTDTECVIALRVDDCCQQAFPATAADIAADPCLMHWPPSWERIPQACLDAWDPICDLVDCAPMGPPSRAVTCGSDGCAFALECTDAEDCRLLVDHRQCCPCPTSWPARMVGHDPCVVPVGVSAPPDCTPPSCQDALCEPCPGDPGTGCQQQTCVDLWLGGR